MAKWKLNWETNRRRPPRLDKTQGRVLGPPFRRVRETLCKSLGCRLLTRMSASSELTGDGDMTHKLSALKHHRSHLKSRSAFPGLRGRHQTTRQSGENPSADSTESHVASRPHHLYAAKPQARPRVHPLIQVGDRFHRANNFLLNQPGRMEPLRHVAPRVNVKRSQGQGWNSTFTLFRTHATLGRPSQAISRQQDSPSTYRPGQREQIGPSVDRNLLSQSVRINRL